ncbi:MAG: hypothetical protein CSA76_00705 [Spirochaetales bacterium]|nr:MAG: hypothetical protein CSA76_00705 [Spirochaetales bacterium]
MTLQQINRVFAAYGRFMVRWRWPLLILLIAFTAFALSGLSKVRTMVSEDSFFSEEDSLSVQSERFERLFGNNEQIAVLLQSDDVFQPQVLQAIQDIGDALLATVPYADQITSLASLDVVVGNDAGIAVINPLAEGIPQTPQAIEKLRDLILSRKGLLGKVVSADSRETWIVLSLHAFPTEAQWVERNEENPLYQVGDAAIAVLTDPKWQSDAYQIKPIGMPYTESEERRVVQHEMKLRVGSGFVLMVVLLAVFLRSWRGVIVPVFTTVFGVTVVFGMMGWLGFAVDQSMALLPVFLGMALSVGYSVHIVNAIKAGLARSLSRHQAVIEAVAHTGWPIAFTALTTMGSMLSFLSAGIILTDWLAWVTAAVVFSVYTYVSLLIPILFSFGRDAAKTTPKKHHLTVDLSRLADFTIRYRRALAWAGVAMVVVLLPALPRINVNMDALEMMGTKIPYLQRVKEITQSQLGSYLTYNIQLDYQDADAIKDPSILENWQTLLDEVAVFPLTKKNADGAKIHSLNDIVRELNQTLNADNPNYYRIPDDRALIAQLLLLYEVSGGKQLYQWIDDAHRSTRAQIEISAFSSNEIVAELKHIEKRGAELFPDGEITLVGMAVKFAEINKRLVTAELVSFFTALLVIAVLMMFVFSSVKTGLIGLIPNLAPIVVIGGVMGYGGFSLDMMTMTIMPMMLGIAVDDTIHFITRIKLAFEQSGCYRQAIKAAFADVAKNLIITTVILAVAFGVLMSSPLNMLTRVGLLSVIGLLAALIADLLLTPALIYITQPFGREQPSPQEGHQ